MASDQSTGSAPLRLGDGSSGLSRPVLCSQPAGVSSVKQGQSLTSRWCGRQGLETGEERESLSCAGRQGAGTSTRLGGCSDRHGEASDATDRSVIWIAEVSGMSWWPSPRGVGSTSLMSGNISTATHSRTAKPRYLAGSHSLMSPTGLWFSRPQLYARLTSFPSQKRGIDISAHQFAFSAAKCPDVLRESFTKIQ